MPVMTIEAVEASKFANGGWRIRANGQYYTYRGNNPPEVGSQADLNLVYGDNGKPFIQSINGEAAPQRQQRAPQPQSHGNTTPAARAYQPQEQAPPAPHGSRDQWILVSAIVGHVIDAAGGSGQWNQEALKTLCRDAAMAARAVAVVFAGAGADAARAAASAAPPPAQPARRYPPTQTKAAEWPEEDEGGNEPRNVGPDRDQYGFDDDIPFN